MSRLDFTSLRVLLVDDSDFMRSLISGILRALKVETVVHARSGDEAIKILKRDARAAARGEPTIDIVLCDLVMEPGDGLKVLRWVRRHRKSPNRFMPFLMISGAVDFKTLNLCRDEGVSEFIAKPFSADTVARRLATAIDNPRPFISAPTYFGPDRRRREEEFVGDDQRVMGEDDVTIVENLADANLANAKESGVWVFKLPNLLKRKLTARFSTGTQLVDPVLLEAATAHVERMAVDYADWVEGLVSELEKCFKEAGSDPSVALARLERMNRIGHELRGGGSTFDYPLISLFGKSLFEHTENYADLEVIEPERLDLIKAHIDAIRTVMKQKIKGGGGQIGKEIRSILDRAVERFKERQKGAGKPKKAAAAPRKIKKPPPADVDPDSAAPGKDAPPSEVPTGATDDPDAPPDNMPTG
ncbi:MAG: response regulator [Alphaproteobacteria bacterium]|nr:response regulator [Alphaproteobacteria bacterium]